MLMKTTKNNLHFRLIQPLCLGQLVEYFAQKKGKETITLGQAYAYASGIVATTAFMLCTFHPYMFYALNGSCKLRVACGGLIYKKALKILKASAEEGQNGKIINILSSDLARFELAFAFLHDIWDGPFEMVLFLGVIYWQISWAGVIGVVFMLAFIPLQGNKVNRI